MSVTGNWRFLLTSKNSSSSKKPATGNNVQPVEFLIRGEIVSKFGNLLLRIGKSCKPCR